MSLRLWTLRFVALVALAIWIGGFTFYGGVIIPTDSLTARLGLAAGFGDAAVVPVRHLTVAPQQRVELRGREGLMRESVVVLS